MECDSLVVMSSINTWRATSRSGFVYPPIAMIFFTLHNDYWVSKIAEISY